MAGGAEVPFLKERLEGGTIPEPRSGEPARGTEEVEKGLGGGEFLEIDGVEVKGEGLLGRDDDARSGTSDSHEEESDAEVAPFFLCGKEEEEGGEEVGDRPESPDEAQFREEEPGERTDDGGSGGGGEGELGGEERRGREDEEKRADDEEGEERDREGGGGGGIHPKHRPETSEREREQRSGER